MRIYKLFDPQRQENQITKHVAHWNGRLLIAQGWAHYHGITGDSVFHSHYPMQLAFSNTQKICITLEDRCTKGQFLLIPSNVRHKIEAGPDPVDLLYIEPTMLSDDQQRQRSLSEWLKLLIQSKPTGIDHRMKQAMSVIDNALSDKITQDKIAMAIGMSKSSFTNLFRATFGMPLRRYVLWRRLNIAVAEIGNGADMTSAAHKAGFSDSAHFSRTMKSTFGVTPTNGLRGIKMTTTASMNPKP